MRVLICSLATVTLALVACSNGNMSAQAQLAARDVCRARYPDAAVDRAVCLNEAQERMALESHYPHMDLIQLTTSYRLMLSEAIDKGEITEAEARVYMAEFGTRVSQEEQRRAAADAAIQAQQSESTTDLLRGLAYWQQATRPYQVGR